ncbi:thioesterase family protein [Falsiporphyromonas endometrii]|uniref:Thioesterase family protein n=1 Tax=Falsiporphyromonas endometrii TaxID=1387297 RepID=A0ABV9K4P0_9PORP|nr:thioesterase family protein [Porphyromonadaceae bacterium]
MIEVGLSKSAKTKVLKENTAVSVGSGDLSVFATPMMVALMENAALSVIQPFLSDEESSVGILINVKHTRASAIGREVIATATIKEVDGRRIVFDVKAEDELGEIGSGVHERFIINKQKFLSKL